MSNWSDTWLRNAAREETWRRVHARNHLTRRGISKITIQNEEMAPGPSSSEVHDTIQDTSHARLQKGIARTGWSSCPARPARYGGALAARVIFGVVVK